MASQLRSMALVGVLAVSSHNEMIDQHESSRHIERADVDKVLRKKGLFREMLRRYAREHVGVTRLTLTAEPGAKPAYSRTGFRDPREGEAAKSRRSMLLDSDEALRALRREVDPEAPLDPRLPLELTLETLAGAQQLLLEVESGKHELWPSPAGSVCMQMVALCVESVQQRSKAVQLLTGTAEGDSGGAVDYVYALLPRAELMRIRSQALHEEAAKKAAAAAAAAARAAALAAEAAVEASSKRARVDADKERADNELLGDEELHEVLSSHLLSPPVSSCLLLSPPVSSSHLLSPSHPLPCELPHR